MNILILILNGFEALALVTGMLYFKRLQHAYLKYFVYLLGFIFLSELAGKFLKLIDARTLNTIWYGFFCSSDTISCFLLAVFKTNFKQKYIYYTIFDLPM
ncbi:MAG: hypothetical protein IPI22_05675 [Bacteroidetes bacterium]|nr:hypothetical protein [Bacteroidota bacterium]